MNARGAKRPIAVNIGRNHRCPCGSGRKFKHCCLGKPSKSRAVFSGGLLWKGPVFLILLVGLIALAVEIAGVRDAGALNSGPALSTVPPAALPSGRTPEPWFYDTVNNQHWHPAHAHWHSGPPPPPEQRQ